MSPFINKVMNAKAVVPFAPLTHTDDDDDGAVDRLQDHSPAVSVWTPTLSPRDSDHPQQPYPTVTQYRRPFVSLSSHEQDQKRTTTTTTMTQSSPSSSCRFLLRRCFAFDEWDNNEIADNDDDDDDVTMTGTTEQVNDEENGTIGDDCKNYVDDIPKNNNSVMVSKHIWSSSATSAFSPVFPEKQGNTTPTPTTTTITTNPVLSIPDNHNKKDYTSPDIALYPYQSIGRSKVSPLDTSETPTTTAATLSALSSISEPDQTPNFLEWTSHSHSSSTSTSNSSNVSNDCCDENNHHHHHGDNNKNIVSDVGGGGRRGQYEYYYYPSYTCDGIPRNSTTTTTAATTTTTTTGTSTSFFSHNTRKKSNKGRVYFWGNSFSVSIAEGNEMECRDNNSNNHHNSNSNSNNYYSTASIECEWNESSSSLTPSPITTPIFDGACHDDNDEVGATMEEDEEEEEEEDESLSCSTTASFVPPIPEFIVIYRQ
jgi:hypothetical protein